MALRGAIGSLSTGVYTVTRTAPGTYDANGKFVAGATSTLAGVVATVQPVSGRQLRDVPEGQRGDELRVIYTETELWPRTPSQAGDRITLDGEAWVIVRAERWQGLGGVHWRAYAARQVTP